MQTKTKWIGVDLDGTLARDDTPLEKPSDIGPPVPAMVARVKRWLAEGRDVRIVTARVHPNGSSEYGLSPLEQARQIQAWCVTHIGAALLVQCWKDYLMLELWDDRAVRVERNRGELCRTCARGTIDGEIRS